jgi:hypothetical protein
MQLLLAFKEKTVCDDQSMNLVLNELEFIRKRLTTYLGDGVALSFMIDQTPIYVNANDSGPTSNIINGGAYEPDNIEVILSFVKPNTIFLDIGALPGASRARAASIHSSRKKIWPFC